MAEHLLNRCSLKQRRIIKDIGRLADSRGVGVYLVGGPVRDLLLGRPVLDLDFTVEGDAVMFARSAAQTLNGRVRVYPEFRTATLILPEAGSVDFVTARKETYASPGALPAVTASNLADDLYRRDFTVNAMAVGVNSSNFGDLVDPFKGREDLANKRIRVLHLKSFEDDPTRVLRAVRFEQRLGFRVEPKTMTLLRKALKEGYAGKVKAPRYFEEFKKSLNEKEMPAVVRRLHGLKAFDFISPRLAPDFQRLSAVHKRWSAAEFITKTDGLDFWVTGLLVLLEGLDESERKLFARRVQLPRAVSSLVEDLSDYAGVLRNLAGRNLPSSRIYTVLNGFPDEGIVYMYVSAPGAAVRQRIKNYWEKLKDIRLFITGSDVKNAGALPGRQVGEVLKKVLHAKIDAKVKTRRDELALARKIIEEGR